MNLRGFSISTSRAPDGIGAKSQIRIPKSQMILRLVACGLLLVALVPADDKKPAADDHPAPPSAATPAASTNSTDYVIGDGDMLAINIWHETELSRVLPVRPDGKISLPLIGDLQATGLTPAQLQANITKQLLTLMEHPEVTVIVQETLSKRFSVVGQVAKPGFYSLNQPLTVLDALALAGGFREFAKVSKMYVLRAAADGSTQRLPFNYKRAIKGEVSENFSLQPRDTLVVP
jgi:polysaccharide export outer membrane protein